MGGIALNALGRHDESIAAIPEAIRLDPQNAVAFYSLGSIAWTMPSRQRSARSAVEYTVLASAIRAKEWRPDKLAGETRSLVAGFRVFLATAKLDKGLLRIPVSKAEEVPAMPSAVAVSHRSEWRREKGVL